MILSSKPGKRRRYLAIEAPVPVARDRQLDRSFGRQDGLGTGTIAMVGDAGLGLLLQVHVHLGVEHALGQGLLQVPDEAAGVQYRLGITTSQQLVQ
jgi:hypothetical protein